METLLSATYINMEKTSKKRINLGCGLDYRKGYLNIDDRQMFPESAPDVSCDMRYWSTDSNSVDEIVLSHVIMYLRPEELDPLLSRCQDWLKVDGTIEIETINFDQVMEHARLNDKSFGLDCIFGTEKTQTHRWGWNISRLRDIIIKNGFTNLKLSNGDKNQNRDFKIIATK